MRTLPMILLVAVATPALADSGMKPGLWEMRVVKNVVDGHDTMAQMAGLSAKMNEQMAKMSPEQRAQMTAMMGQGGMGMGMAKGGDAALQMCITPEMAKRDMPATGRDPACQPTNVQASGNHMTYAYNCASGGSKTTGTGEWTSKGDTVTSRSDTTTVEHGETHHVQNETEFRFLKADCGNVRPLAEKKPR